MIAEEIAICQACEIPNPQCEWTDPGCKLAEFKGIQIKPRQPKVVKVIEAKPVKVKEPKITVPRVNKSTHRRSEYWKAHYQARREAKIAAVKLNQHRLKTDPQYRADRQMVRDARTPDNIEQLRAAANMRIRQLANEFKYGDMSHFGTLKTLYAGNIQTQG